MDSERTVVVSGGGTGMGSAVARRQPGLRLAETTVGTRGAGCGSGPGGPSWPRVLVNGDGMARERDCG